MLAAGRGTRFGGPLPKAFLPLAGKPLLLHAAERLAAAIDLRAGNQLVVVIHADDRATLLEPLLPQLRQLGDVRVAAGGNSRQESMANGLAACAADRDLVVIHDAARALLPVAATRECLRQAQATGASLLAIPVPDTLKRVQGTEVTATVDRSNLWQAQTPQVIRLPLLRRALAHAAARDFAGTDDVSLVEQLGERVVVVPGTPTNLKITRPEDLPLAEAILAAGLA